MVRIPGVSSRFVVDADPVYVALMAGVDLAGLVGFRRPAWHADAACRGMGTSAWFPARHEDVRPAKAICAACPVAGPCGAAAGEAGIWAGTSARERRRTRRAA